MANGHEFISDEDSSIALRLDWIASIGFFQDEEKEERRGRIIMARPEGGDTWAITMDQGQAEELMKQALQARS